MQSLSVLCRQAFALRGMSEYGENLIIEMIAKCSKICYFIAIASMADTYLGKTCGRYFETSYV